MKAVFAYEHELTRGALLIDNKAVFVCGDANAHEIRLTLKNNGVNAQLEGWDCQAYCVLNNRATAYSEEASLEGNVVSVTFPGSFYAMAGDTLVILRMLKEDAKIDLLYFMYTVRPGITSTVYDPSGELPDLSDFQAAISACDAAKKAANDAAGTANASAENAEAQAAAARSAADKAYKSASAADDAAADAILAAGDADDATDAANQAAATANAAAQRVEDAIDGAADAADAANAAAALVDGAIAASEQATQGAQASAAAATQAAQEAEAKAALADEAAQGAEASAGEANAAAGRANAAAESIEGLTISESVVEYGAGVEAVVSRDPESGALHLAIQTERGPQGPGYTIKGEAYATVEALEAAVTSPAVGDQYNVGAAAPYNVYRWTGEEWEDQGTVQGPAGLDAPQINDDEALSTNPWSGLKTQEEIAKVEGKIYPCTSQALEDMSQEQQAELYTQGYRAIKTENNGTVVLLGLASDGSLEWLGCNQPRKNLFDNPDFSIAKDGYGGMHGVVKYAADRWVASNLSTVSFEEYKLVVVDDGSSTGAVYQVLIFDRPCKITISAGVTVQSAWKITVFDTDSGAEITSSAGSQDQEALLNAEITSDLIGKKISVFFYLFPSAAGGSAQIFKTSVYVGSYTPKTLPPWVAPDPVVERVNCMRYYQSIPYNLSRTYLSTDADYPSRFQILYPQTMRITPTVALTESWSSALTNITTDYVSEKGLCIAIAANDTTAYVEWHGTITLSADL